MVKHALLTPADLRARITSFCSAQHGVVAMYQLVESGASKHAVSARVRAGWLVPVHEGVYGVAGSPLTARGRAMAAVLAAGPGAVASHWTAAWLLSLDHARPMIHVLKPGGMNRVLQPFDGYGKVVVHSTRRLETRELIAVAGIPATNFIRTTIDLAGGMKPAELDRFLADADRENLLRLGDLENELGRWTGKKGMGMLRRVLRDWHPASEDEMLIFENEFVSDLVAAGAPRPQINPLLDDHLIDCLYPQYKVMFELDGHAYHRDPATQTKDAARDRKHTMMGYQVNRFTRQEYLDNRARVIAEALDLLRNRGWPGPDAGHRGQTRWVSQSSI